MGPSAAWFYEGQLRPNRNWKPSTVGRLQHCMAAVGDWCTARRLPLNPSKTELVWFGLRLNPRKIGSNGLSFQVDKDGITPVDIVRDLDVMLNSELTVRCRRHVNKVVNTSFCHISRLKQTRRLIGPDETATLVSAFVLSRLDYCNTVLAGLPKSTIAPLQRGQNAATSLIVQLCSSGRVFATLRQLHWLPVEYRITYKLRLLVHLIHTSRAPSYLMDVVIPAAAVSSIATSVRQESSLRTTVNVSQFRTASIFICSSVHMEQTAALGP